LRTWRGTLVAAKSAVIHRHPFPVYRKRMQRSPDPPAGFRGRGNGIKAEGRIVGKQKDGKGEEGKRLST